MPPTEPPAAHAQEPPDLPDYSTKAGAKMLAATIRNVWRQRGYAVSVECFEVPGAPRHFGIRTSLVAGLPRREWREAA